MLGVLLVRTLVRSLKEAATPVTRLAASNLTTVIEVRSSDELGEVMRTMGTMRAGLSSIARDVQGGVVSVVHSTLQVSVGNHDLSARTEQQVAALGETAFNMEELTSTVAQNADHARVASALAEQASTIVVDDGQIIQRVM